MRMARPNSSYMEVHNTNKEVLMEVEQGVPKIAYSLPELMEMFQVSRASIYRWVNDGKFPKPVKMGELSFWPVSEVQSWWEDKIVMER